MPINTQPETLGTVTMADTDIVNITLNGPGGNVQMMSVTAVGTWDGDTLAFQVSNDGVNYFQALDSAGNTLALTADGGMTLISQEYCMAYGYCRLTMTGGGTPSVVVTVYGGRG